MDKDLDLSKYMIGVDLSKEKDITAYIMVDKKGRCIWMG